VGLGHLRATGHPHGGPWRQFHGTAGGGSVLETPGTLLHGNRVPAECLVRLLACLAEGVGIRGTARGFEVAPNPVLQWLVEAADELNAVSQYFLPDVRVTQGQLDERSALLRAVKDGEVSEVEALQRLSRSPRWGWGALDPVPKRLLTIDVGDRTLAMAQRVGHQLVQVLAPGCVPLFLTAGFKAYMTALLAHYGPWGQPSRRRAQGPAPKPRCMPLPELLYAQVVNSSRCRRVVRVRPRVVFGPVARVNWVLAATGWQLNTACIERVNGAIRQHVAAVGRRVITLGKGEEGLRQQWVVYQMDHNFCLPHAALRQPLPPPLPTNGMGSAKRWRPCTPAMAAGLTDHVWTVRDVRLCRVPPWPQSHAI
jgi:IS1 family transposase